MGAGPSIGILGAGAGGLAMAVRLKQAGFHDLTIFEKSERRGRDLARQHVSGRGVRHHVAPLFVLVRASEPRVEQDLRGPTGRSSPTSKASPTRFGIRPHLRLGTPIAEARWDDTARRWKLTAETGELFEVDVLVSALGMLNLPALPGHRRPRRLRGHDLPLGPLEPRRGSGRQADRGDRDQGERRAVRPRDRRNPPRRCTCSSAPRRGSCRRRCGRTRPRRSRSSGAVRWRCASTAGRSSLSSNGTRRSTRPIRGPPSGRAGTTVCCAARSRTTKTSAPRFTPDYAIGCKRLLPSNTWFPTFTRPDVELVTDPINRVTKSGVRDRRRPRARGRHDHPRHRLPRHRVPGRRGRVRARRAPPARRLGRRRRGVPGYDRQRLPEPVRHPYGPNTNQGGGSILFVLEAQAHYITRAVRTLARRRVAAMEVRASAQRRFNDRLQQAMDGTVWLDCHSYFRAPNGRVTTQRPYPARRYWLETRRLRTRDYDLLPR
ncbi:NAD(P)-binding protein [Yinghuangia aomiensis]